MITLPEEFVISGLEIAKGASLFYKRFDDMTRDELIASAAHGWKAANNMRDRFYKEWMTSAGQFAADFKNGT